MLRKIHLYAGMLGLVVFALQGQYMDLVHEHLANTADAPRMLYRSSHIYFLLVSVINVVLGVYLKVGDQVVKPAIQLLVSGVVLLSPIALLAGFFLEPGMVELMRPYTRPALYALFGTGVVLSLLDIFGLNRR
jgi:Na+-driven multidrug efflux pump